MIEWISELVGVNLSNVDVSAVAPYIYAGAVALVVVMALILFSELAGFLRDLIGWWSRK